MNKHLIFVFLFLLSLSCSAQQWGLYTLYATDNGTAAYLIDTNSTTYKSWTFSSSAKSTYSTYLTPEKVLVRTYSPTGAWGGGGCTGGVQKVDWSGTVIWDFQYFATNDYCLHHDICPMPNGNVLMICYDYKTSTEAVQAGLSSSAAMYSERIIEVQPTGATTGTIVWEWYLWDHMCQSYNSGKDNYVTNTADHPELMNINYAGTGSLPDRYHMNGIDYNAELDQIVVSMHYMNSAFVIDHSTTTAQAAGHTGGNSGKGGDFLYRWGNPASYGATGTTVFNVIHDAHWVPSDNPNYPDYLCGYNNQGGTSGRTAITIWNPPYSGNSYTFTAGTVNPTTYAYQFTTLFSASNKGNSQQLPNGNILICNPMGAIYEINSSGTNLWTKASANSCHAYRYDKCYVRGPVASISTDTSICQGESISLNGTATSVTETSPTYTWAWSGTNGYSSTTQNNTVSPTTTTTYTLTVTNTALSCWDTATVIVNVHPAPTIAASASPASVCSGYSTSVTASGGSTYSWNTGATTSSITVSPTTATTYTVTGTSNGCSNTATVSVSVLTSPTVSASASPATVCAGQSATLTASGADTYAWNNSSSGSSINVTPTSTTTYTVTGTAANGCTNTSTVAVTVSASAALSVSASAATICYGNSTTITATGATNYTWSSSQTTSTITVSPTTTTTYSVTGTSSGCTGTGSISITVNPLPTITSNASPATVCSGQSSTLNAIGGSTYAWSNSAGSGSSVTVSPTSTTSYTVTGTNANSCSNTSTVSITVNPSPAATASASPASVCAGVSSTLTAGGGDNYSWSNSLGSSSNVTVTPASTTIYTVTVSYTSGCSSTASATVTVNAIPTVAINPSLPSLCTGQSTTLTATGGSTYIWNQGLGSGNSFTVSPAATTTYNVTGTSSAGCSNTATVTIPVNACTQPTASVSASNYDFCAGQPITISDISTGINVDTWSWSFPGSNMTSSTQQGPHTITYYSPGTYTISLVVADDNGMDDTSITVTVHAVPSVSLSASPSSVCMGSSSTLTAGGATTYSWNQGLPAGSTQTVSPTIATTYNVTGTNTYGCENSASVTISILASPTITLTAGTNNLCEGTSTTLTAGGGTSYVWDQGLSGTSAIVSPTVPTTYHVTGTDINGCQNTASVSISIIAAPTIAINASPTAVCYGQSSTLTASGASMYSWNTGSNASHIVVTPTVTTTYNLTGLSSAGCSATASVTVTVSTGAMTLISTPPSICSGESALLTASGGVSYIWNNGLGTGSSQNVTPSSTTTYQITGTDVYGCSGTASVTVLVYSLPSTPAITQNGNNLTSTAGNTYQWYLDGVAISGATTQTITATQNGNYTVVVTNSAGCSATSEPFAFELSGISELNGETVIFVPNPSNGFIQLSGNMIENNSFSVRISDVTGNTVMSFENRKSADLHGLADGIYFITVRSNADNRTFVGKLILNK